MGNRLINNLLGNGSRSIILNRTNIVYKIEDLLNKDINNKTQKYHSNSIKKEEKNIIQLERYFSDEEFINDFWNLKYNELLEKYQYTYYIFESTPLDFSNDDIPYVLLPNNYIEIKRYWLMDNIYNEDGDIISKTSKVRKIKNGNQRKKKLFINGILRRMMIQNLSFEHLLNNLVYELYYFIDNREDKIDKKKLFEIAKNVFKEDISKYSNLINKDEREFIVNPYYCEKYNVTKRQARNIAKKELNYQRIGELYDCSLTDKENLTLFKEYGLEISLITLKRFRKDNNITKNKKQNKSQDSIITEETIELSEDEKELITEQLNDEYNELNIEDNMINKEQIETRLSKWNECKTIDELNQKWINAKKYIIKESESIEERFAMDLLIEKYYSIASKSIA